MQSIPIKIINLWYLLNWYQPYMSVQMQYKLTSAQSEQIEMLTNRKSENLEQYMRISHYNYYNYACAGDSIEFGYIGR